MATARTTHANTSTATTKPPATTGAPAHDRSAARAYEIWQATGRPHGHDQEHWFQAERELRGGQAQRPQARNGQRS